MPDIMHFLVIHIPTGKMGRGDSVWTALDQAIGKKESLKFHACQPPRGYFWTGLQTRTLGTTDGSRRTVQSARKMYQLNAVYQNDPAGPAKDKTMLLVVYRSPYPDVLDQLPDNGPTKTQSVQKNDKKNRRG